MTPPVPHDRGLADGGRLNAAGGPQHGGLDFLALLTVAEPQDGAALPGRIVPADQAATDEPATGVTLGMSAATPQAASVQGVTSGSIMPASSTGQRTGSLGLLHAVSQLALSAPEDSGVAAGGPQHGGLDFLALLTVAEPQDRAALPGGVVPADPAATDEPATGVTLGMSAATPQAASVQGVTSGSVMPVSSTGQRGGSLGLLHPVSQIALSAPEDSGVAAGGTQHGGLDVRGQLVNAEAHDRAALPGRIVPADPAATDEPATGVTLGMDAATPQAAPVQGVTPHRARLNGDEGVPSAGEQPSAAPVAPSTRTGVTVQGVGAPQQAPVHAHAWQAATQTLAGSDAAPPFEGVPPSASIPAGLPPAGWHAAPVPRGAWETRILQSGTVGDDLAALAGASNPPAEMGEEPLPRFVSSADTAFPEPTSAAAMASPALVEYRGLPLASDALIANPGPLPGHFAPPSPSAPILAQHYQRVFFPPLSAQLAPALLTMDLAPAADGGPTRLTVAIRPVDLGGVQIIAELAEDKVSRIAVLAERPETLHLLVRDATTLESVLRAAGIGDGVGLSLSFGLASQGKGDRDGRPQGPTGRGDSADAGPSAISETSPMGRTGLIDLSL